MQEKRRSKRVPLDLELTISSLFKQKNDIIPDINTKIEVKNISKTGLGFMCNDKLPISYYFNAKIRLPGNQFFNSVIKIIRIEEHKDTYYYGCEFVGLADILSRKIDVYQEDLESDKIGT